MNILLVSYHKSNDLITAAVTDAEPDKLWWLSVKQASLVEIRVLGHDCETIRSRILPNLVVANALQSAVTDVNAVRKLNLQQAR